MSAWESDLARVGATPDRFGPDGYQGIVNVYVKLRALGLWPFVKETVEIDRPGNLHFLVADVAEFQEALVAAGLDGPEYDGLHWESREPVAHLSLHIKHFDTWAAEKVQAHVDPVGLVDGPWWKRLWIGLRHLLNFHGYSDVRRVKRMLEADGLRP